MSEKEITPRTAGPGSGDAPASQAGSIVVLSDDEVERIAGGVKFLNDAWGGSAATDRDTQYTLSTANQAPQSLLSLFR